MSRRDAVADAAATAYRHVAPKLGCDSPCRSFALVALGAAHAADLGVAFHYDPAYVEDGIRTAHFWLRFDDGAVLDCWRGEIRLIEPERGCQ